MLILRLCDSTEQVPRVRYISKDTLICMISAHRCDYQRYKAAQPCSYIYPIYAVVKNRFATAFRDAYAL